MLPAFTGFNTISCQNQVEVVVMVRSCCTRTSQANGTRHSLSRGDDTSHLHVKPVFHFILGLGFSPLYELELRLAFVVVGGGGRSPLKLPTWKREEVYDCRVQLERSIKLQEFPFLLPQGGDDVTTVLQQ